jgi:hypothetical protein
VVFALHTVPSTRITHVSASGFNLPTPASYLVLYQITALGAGHLVLTLNKTEQLHTIISKNATIGQLSFVGVVTTSEPDTVLTVRNPSNSISTLRITANEGAPLGVSNHLVVIQL